MCVCVCVCVCDWEIVNFVNSLQPNRIYRIYLFLENRFGQTLLSLLCSILSGLHANLLHSEFYFYSTFSYQTSLATNTHPQKFRFVSHIKLHFCSNRIDKGRSSFEIVFRKANIFRPNIMYRQYDSPADECTATQCQNFN